MADQLPPVPDFPYQVWDDPNWMWIDNKEADRIINKTQEDIVIIGTNVNDPEERWGWLVRENRIFDPHPIDKQITEDELRSSVYEVYEDFQDGQRIFFNKNGVLFYFYKRAS